VVGGMFLYSYLYWLFAMLSTATILVFVTIAIMYFLVKN